MKQSQFPDCGFRIADWGQVCVGTPGLWPAASDPRGSIVRNKANSESRSRRLCKQSQLPASGPEGRGPPRLAIPPRRRQSVRNKANSVRASLEVSALIENSYDRLDPRERSEKQSQFRNGRTGAVASKPVGSAGGGRLYKQSQFAEAPRDGRGPAKLWLGCVAPNKANLAPGRVRAGVGRAVSVGNRVKQSQFPESGGHDECGSG